MRWLAEQLLKDIAGEQIDDLVRYSKLCTLSKRFPRVKITIESDFKKIKKQYIDICRVIINNIDKNRKGWITITLFNATEQLMLAYREVDFDIVKLHALWFSDVLEELNGDTASTDSVVNFCDVLYFVLVSMIIVFVLKKIF